jgi:UrcA family protein
MDYCKLRAPLSLGCAALVLVCLGGITPAQAADVSGARQVTVKYRDLNLETPEGAGTLLARIRDAARRVCGTESERLDLQHAWQVCYQGSVDAAVASVDSPILTALASGGRLPGGDRSQPQKAAPRT